MKINKTIFKVDHNEIVLRSPEIFEAGQLLTYFRNLFHESSHYLNFPSDFYDAKNKDHQENFIDLFNKANRSFVVTAFLDDEIVGHIIIDNLGFQQASHRAKVVMGVLNKVQNKGLGSQLLQYAINHLDEANILALELQVRVHNLPAIKLYEKCNFVRIGHIQAAAYIDGEYVDEFVYQRLSSTLKETLEKKNCMLSRQQH